MSAPSWRDMIEAATAKGMLAKEFFVVFTEPTGDLEAVQKARAEHLEYQVAIEQKGIMFAAGPFSNEAGFISSVFEDLGENYRILVKLLPGYNGVSNTIMEFMHASKQCSSCGGT